MTDDDGHRVAPDRLLTSRPEGEAIRIALEPSMSAVESGRCAILRHLAPLALGEQVINRIEVVFEELVGNLVRHGVADAGGTAIMTVDLLARRDEIEMVVEDNGPEFNPLEMTTPSRFTTLEEAELGGLGIPLIRRLSRKLRYERVEAEESADGMPRNRVVVTIARQ